MVIQYPLSCLHMLSFFSGAVEDIVSFSFANFFNIEVMKFIPYTHRNDFTAAYVYRSADQR